MSTSNGETVNASTISDSQHSAARLGSVVYLSIVGVIGLIANGLVIAAFWRYPKLRTATKNLFILNLAVCDLVLATLDTTFSISSSFRGKWLYGSAGCNFYGFFHYFFISNTVSTLAVISVDRFYYITKPGRAHTSIITKFRAGVVIGIIYAYTFVFTVPPVMGWNSFVKEKYFVSGCYIDYSDQSATSISYSLTASVFLFLFPLAVMLYCYVKIFLAVRKSTRRTITRKHSAISKAGNTARKKFPLMKRTHIQTAKMIVMAVFFSMIVWVPYVLVSLIKAFSGGNNSWSVASHITVLIAKSCVIYNVLIYVVLNRKFKVALLNMICCRKWSKETFVDKYMLDTSARQRLSRFLSDTDRDAISQTAESQKNRVTVLNSPHQRWSLPSVLLEDKGSDSSVELSKNQHGHYLQRSVEFDKEISFQNLTSGDNNGQFGVIKSGSAAKNDNEADSSTIKPLKSNLKNSPRTPDKLVVHAVAKADEKGIPDVKEKDMIKGKTAGCNAVPTGVNGRANFETKVSTLAEAKQTALNKLKALSKRKLPNTPQKVNLSTKTSDVSDNIDTTKKCEGPLHVSADKGGQKLISTSTAANDCLENVDETQPSRPNGGMLGAYKLVRAASQRKNGGIAPLRQSRHLNSRGEVSSARESIRSLYSYRESFNSLKDAENQCQTLQYNSSGSVEKGSIPLKRNSRSRRSEKYRYGRKRTKTVKCGTKTTRRNGGPSKHHLSKANSLEVSPKELENIQNYWKRMSLCLDEFDLDDVAAVPV